jgi:hypothetical protein
LEIVLGGLLISPFIIGALFIIYELFLIILEAIGLLFGIVLFIICSVIEIIKDISWKKKNIH